MFDYGLCCACMLLYVLLCVGVVILMLLVLV